ncbi:MFS transporter [Devriesea agamarum]|uniref:MFS transporter n=1 Tax=Devriesea agamarum TaxID=472569 RepID=UPI00071E00D8|nr:MFS transporter [Devriesea agamarum]
MPTSKPSSEAPARGVNPKQAVPLILALFVFSLIIDNGFKNLSQPIATNLGISPSEASLQATLAGILIGIGAVVYATLADSISMRKLLIFSVIVMCAGSLFGFIFSSSFPMVLIGRIVQTMGLAAAETLYVIYVTKYLSRKDQKTFLGFSTSAYQLSLFFGVLTSGYIAGLSSSSWSWMFLVPLLAIVTIPSILRTVPRGEVTSSRVDVLGLFLVAVVATCLILFMQQFQFWYLLPALIAVVVFIWHIRAHRGALVDASFFLNHRYTTMLAVNFIMYSVQLAYLFVFPFLLRDLHGLKIDESSYVLAPAYLVAAIVGALTGAIGKFLSSRQAITVAMLAITISLVIPAVFVEFWIGMYTISMILFASGFALMYAPLMSTAIRDIPRERSGVAIGFYNLVINIAVPIGIAYTAKLVDVKPTFLSFLTTSGHADGQVYSTILFIIAAITIIGLIVYQVAISALTKSDARRGISPESEPVVTH